MVIINILVNFGLIYSVKLPPEYIKRHFTIQVSASRYTQMPKQMKLQIRNQRKGDGRLTETTKIKNTLFLMSKNL